MKKLLVIVVVVAMTLVGASAALATVAGTKHDLHAVGAGSTVTETCVFCHTPHQAAAANGQDPLWNRTLSSVATYGVYANLASINASDITEIGAGTLGSATLTHLCLSCHDGTLAVNAPLNAPNVGVLGAATFITSSATLGTSLSDDHPVNFTYNATLVTNDGGLAAVAAVAAAGLPLDGNSKLQCSTCHNVHDNSYPPFLRIANTNSAMCTTCHINK